MRLKHAWICLHLVCILLKLDHCLWQRVLLTDLLQFKFPATAPNLESKFPVRRFDFDGRTLSEAGFVLLSSLLTLDPEKRATAAEALEHRW